MIDIVLLNGDEAQFKPAIGGATVSVRSGTISGTGLAMQGGKNVCLEGDEESVVVSGCVYFTPVFSVPGIGTLKIDSLGSDQKSLTAKIQGRSLLLKGNNFNSKFEVTAPAMMPPPASVPDPTAIYMGGTGDFKTGVGSWKSK